MNNTKSVEYWTRKELEELPLKLWNENIGKFNSLVILPRKKLHDSGFRLMYFVAVNDNDIPFCKLSGCSDVLNIDGISGYGKWIDGIPSLIKPKLWSIDCLKTSGLLRLWSNYQLETEMALSSFEVFSIIDN